MATDFTFRKRAVGTLTTSIGVYILCDLDNVPIYVGQSTDGIRQRVQRHLTSARSDIIANRQIDVWEIAYVWSFPVTERSAIGQLEAKLFHHYNSLSPLMNGAQPAYLDDGAPLPDPAQIVQVMSDEEIAEKREATQRLPRQAAHYAQIVSHFLSVKNSTEVSRAMDAHFERLRKYHVGLLGIAESSEESADD